MNDKVYEFLKWCSIILPIIATLYVALADVWGFPYRDQIAATALAVEAALTSLLKVLSNNYFRDKVITDAPKE